MKWAKRYDGGLYEGVREDGLSASIIKMGVGQKGWTVSGTYYAVKVDGRGVGAEKFLKDAKALGATPVPR